MFRVERLEFGKQTAGLWCGQVAASILQLSVCAVGMNNCGVSQCLETTPNSTLESNN